MTPGPPPGQPLLNANENQDLDNFFQGFDQNAAANKPLTHTSFNVPIEHDQLFNMPPMFVGSDTALGHRSVIDPHQLTGNGYPYGHGLMGHDMSAMSHGNPLAGGMHAPNYGNAAFPNPLIAQLQSAASMQPAYTHGWQQSFPTQQMMNLQTQGRLGMGFGTDARFQPTGYAAPQNPMDPDLPQGLHMGNPIGDWLEPTSASTTQPNTQPNTQPSSPNWSKKRNFEDFTRDHQPRNGLIASTQQRRPTQPSSPQSNPRRKRSVVKTETKTPNSQPRTPLSNSKPHTPLDAESLADQELAEQEEDAEAEDDEEEDTAAQPRSPSPAPWPGSKPRPPKNTKVPPPKAPRKKKASAKASTPSRPKSKASASHKSTPTRTPLSLEQKKANHTSSEQRRRDATARSYAELYDLCPELEDLGKQSTMKKLEVIVDKVRRVKERVEEMRAKLNVDPTTGRALAGASGGSSMSLYSDVPTWHQ